VKAFLLAAGLGTRLKPITNQTPKCLVEIAGKPLLAWWIDLFEKHSITEVLVNLHYLSDKVVSYLESYPTEIKFNYFYEDILLGSGGTLRENKHFISNEVSFFIIYADNLTNYNLTAFLDFHNSHDNPFSLALFRTDTPQTKGIVQLDNNNNVISFEEKPREPKSDLANAGIYIASPAVLDLIPNAPNADIGFDLLPKLVGNMRGWESKDYLIDIGTIEHLKKANVDWQKIIKGA